MILALAAQAVFACTPTHVWDGDGPIWCAEGPRLRLASLATRELDGSCRRGHPCPRASGIAARDRLVRLLGGPRGFGRDGHVLVRGPQLTCHPIGRDHDRDVAFCVAPRVGNLSCAMVQRGYGLSWPARDRPGACDWRP